MTTKDNHEPLTTQRAEAPGSTAPRAGARAVPSQPRARQLPQRIRQGAAGVPKASPGSAAPRRVTDPELRQRAQFYNDDTQLALKRRREQAQALFKQIKKDRYSGKRKGPLFALCVQALLDRTIDLARHKDKGVSRQTMHMRKIRVSVLVAELAAVGIDLYRDTPMELRGRHISRLVNAWVDASEGLEPKYPVRRYCVKSIHNMFSHVRWLMESMGRTHEVAVLREYVRDTRRVALDPTVKTDESWAGAGIDVEAWVAQAAQMDPRLAVAFQVMEKFGLRIREAVRFNPIADIVDDVSAYGLKAHGLGVVVRRGRALSAGERVARVSACAWAASWSNVCAGLVAAAAAAPEERLIGGPRPQ